MNSINSELKDFKIHHKNPFNIKFHILCGFTYMTFLLLLFKSFRYEVLILYSFLISRTINIPHVTYLLLFISMEIFYKKNISLNNSFLLIMIFYLLPELSHYITNEKSLLNINTLTPFSVIINILYLLPFSINCLISS